MINLDSIKIRKIPNYSSGKKATNEIAGRNLQEKEFIDKFN